MQTLTQRKQLQVARIKSVRPRNGGDGSAATPPGGQAISSRQSTAGTFSSTAPVLPIPPADRVWPVRELMHGDPEMQMLVYVLGFALAVLCSCFYMVFAR